MKINKNKNNELTKLIMDYWSECAYRDSKSDWLINDLLSNYLESIGVNQNKLDSDLYSIVDDITNSQKRKLLKLMQESGIK